MTCLRTPPCKPCEASRPCAHVLSLSAAQEAQLRRILELVGENPNRNVMRVTVKTSTAQVGLMGRDDEPRTERVCPDCGRTTQQYTYLHDFLVTNHVRLPACPVCVADTIAA